MKKNINIELEEILNNVNCTFWTRDVNNENVFVSAGIQKLSGYSRSQFLQNEKFWIDICHPEDIPLVLEIEEKLFQGKEVQSEIRCIHANGDILWVEIRGTPIFNSSGEIIRFDGTVFDISKRKKAENELMKKRAEVKNIIKSLNVVAWSIDFITGEVVCSSNAEKIYGFHSYVFNDYPHLWKKLVHPNDLSMVQKREQQLLAGEEATSEYRIIRPKDNKIVWIEDRGKPILDKNNKVIGIKGVLLDITERREIESTKQQLEKQLELILMNLDLTLITRDFKTRKISLLGSDTLFNHVLNKSIQYFNKPFPHPWDEIIIEDDQSKLSESFKKLLMGEQVDIVFRIKQQNKETQWVQGFVTPFLDSDDQIEKTIGIFKDITDTKKQEEKMRKQEQLSLVGELAAAIAHEIRNPLTSVQGFAKLLKEDPADMYYDVLNSELKRVNSIVDELMLLSKPNKESFKRKNLTKILKDCVTLLQVEALIHNITIDLQNIDDIFIDCNEIKIKQVFINIIKNAIESMENRGKITINVFVKNGNVSIFIKDQGRGIPEHILKRLGKPFNTTKEKGTGLGLMVCKNIIDIHKGSIHIDSQEQIGTTVKIVLPLWMNK